MFTKPQFDMLLQRIDEATEAQQAYADATVTGTVDPVADRLYEATYELCHLLSNTLARPGFIEVKP